MSGSAGRAIVIGGDAAGATAATRIKDSVPAADVVMLEKGAWTSYSACGIPYHVSGDVPDAKNLVARAPEQHRANGIDVRMQTTATRIDRGAREVHVAGPDGTTDVLGYDVLVIATGAHPQVPDVSGLAEHAVGIHTLDEGISLSTKLVSDGITHAAVLGAGYIGIEAAEALVTRGIGVTLIDRGEQVMKSLDPDLALLIQQRLGDLGVTVRLGEEVVDVDVDGATCRAVLTRARDGRAVEAVRAEVVVIALGSRPQVDLAAGTGMVIGPSGAIAVDDRGRTSDARIWAAGDCAESVHMLTGHPVNIQLGTHANKQGKVVGLDAAATLLGTGRSAVAFPGVVGSAVTRLCGLDVGRTGLSTREASSAGWDVESAVITGTVAAGYMPDPGSATVKLLAERGSGRIVGGQIIGTSGVAKRIDVPGVWCQLGVTVEQAQMMDLAYAPPFGGAWDLWQVAARKLVSRLGLPTAL